MKNFILLLTFAIGLQTFVGCSEDSGNSSGTTTNTDDGNGDGGDNNGDGSVNNNNTGSNTQANCTGTSSDGTGDGPPLYRYRMTLSGHETWVPGNYTEALQLSTMPNLADASLIFKSDSKLRVRFLVNSQPYPTAGEEYCYGRQTGVFSDPYFYTKLRWRVALRDIICNNVNAQDPTKCDSELELGPAYNYQFIDPVSVGSCSPILDLGAQRNFGTFGTVIQVDDVKADSACQYNGSFCPAEKIVRKASCWDITLQIATDFTQDFKL